MKNQSFQTSCPRHHNYSVGARRWRNIEDLLKIDSDLAKIYELIENSTDFNTRTLYDEIMSEMMMNITTGLHPQVVPVKPPGSAFRFLAALKGGDDPWWLPLFLEIMKFILLAIDFNVQSILLWRSCTFSLKCRRSCPCTNLRCAIDSPCLD